ncbi:MAG: hypothetical protein Q8J84_02715 [Flavobacteriaceae bacterium]|nr:hypothetical protein [Flavobacteriaceae bacterium]
MKRSKIIMIIGALMMLLLFVFPLYNITLEAPQYPEPLGMDIWINKVTDHNPNDIKNINLMNHYIGMRDVPIKIKEFEIFPIVIIIMASLGVLIGLIGRRKLYLTWGIVMIILGIVGMYDFYLWLYDYGHNLNPHAAIKIPGQGYMPPLFGAKSILNFNAISLPMTGAYFMIIGIILSFIAFFQAKKEAKKVYH